MSFFSFRLLTILWISCAASASSKRQNAAAASKNRISLICQTPSKTRPSFVSKNAFISVAPIFVLSLHHQYGLILRQKTRFSCSYHTMFLSFCNPHSTFFRKSTPLHLPKRSGKRRFSFGLPTSNLHGIAPTFRQAPLFISEFPQALCVTLPPMFRQAPLFLSKFSQAICVASPRRSGKRRFLGKKSSKDVTRRTGIHAQHIFPDASLLFFVLFSNRTKASLSHATNFKKLYRKFFHYF